MRTVEQLPSLEPELQYNDEQCKELESWLMIEVTDALSARSPLERIWRECLRRYEGVPKNPVRNTPVVNAPNIEVTIGAGKSNPVTVDEAEALQDFTNRVATSELNLREAYDDATLDDVQLGTG